MKITTIRTVKLVERDIENALREYIEKFNPGVTIDVETMKTKPGLPTSLEITVEEDTGTHTEAKEKSHSHAKKTAHKSEKLEPTAAMATLPGFARVNPVQTQEAAPAAVQAAPQAPQATLPLVGEEKGHVEEKPSTSAAQTIVEEPKAPEPAPPPKASSLFANLTRPKNV